MLAGSFPYGIQVRQVVPFQHVAVVRHLSLGLKPVLVVAIVGTSLRLPYLMGTIANAICSL